MRATSSLNLLNQLPSSDERARERLGSKWNNLKCGFAAGCAALALPRRGVGDKVSGLCPWVRALPSDLLGQARRKGNAHNPNKCRYGAAKPAPHICGQSRTQKFLLNILMPEMYCPKCGRELDLGPGDIRYCRYCGFSLLDTKDALQGYSERKRVGLSIVAWSYSLLLVVTLLLHGQYVSLNTGWVYWLLTLLIVLSVSFFASAAVSAMKPAMFSRSKRPDKATLQRESTGALKDSGAQLPPSHVPVTDLSGQDVRREPFREPRSVVEGTTKRLNDRRS